MRPSGHSHVYHFWVVRRLGLRSLALNTLRHVLVSSSLWSSSGVSDASVPSHVVAVFFIVRLGRTCKEMVYKTRFCTTVGWVWQVLLGDQESHSASPWSTAVEASLV